MSELLPKSPRVKLLIITSVLVLGVLLRLQNFSLPPVDGHPMRQTDTESVAYNFAFNNPNILYPQNSLMRPVSNTESYFFLEFPVYEYIIAIGYMLFGWHIEVARIINILLYLLAAGSLYYFVKHYFDDLIALFSLAFFTFSPASIFFIGHALHPDVFAVTMLTTPLAAYIKWKHSKNVLFFVGSSLALSLAVATRPFALLILPAFLFLIWVLKGKKWEYPVIVISSFVLYGLWYSWTKRFKDIADHSWENWILYGQELLAQADYLINILILKNIAGEVIGKFVFLLVLIGLITIVIKFKKKYLFPIFWLMGVPLYWYLAPNGNLYHQYYANIYMIPLLLLAAIGLNFIITNKLFSNRLVSTFLLLAIFSMTLYNGYRTSSYFFNDPTIPEFDLYVAEDIRKIVPPDERLLFYQTLNSVPFSIYHRKGWMLGASPTDVSPNPEDILNLKQYGLKYIVESKRAPMIPPEVMEDLEKEIELIYSSSWTNIYKIK